MKNRKNLVLTAIIATLTVGLNIANANSLTQMDVKKSSAADTVDVTFYTTDNSSNNVVTRKGNNRYVVLLPNVSSNPSVTPSIGGLKDIITDINVKHIDDGIGGYTKVTFETSKPINIKTYNKKSTPLTQAQKDAKTIIAQNTTPASSTVKPQPAKPQTAEKPTANTTVAKPATAQPAAQTQKTSQPKVSNISKTTVPEPKITFVEPQKTDNTKVNSAPKTEQPKVKNDFVEGNYNPKMSFDENGNRKMDLEPRVSHQNESAVESKTSTTPTVQEDNPKTNTTPIQSESSNSDKSKNLSPLLALLGLGTIFGLGGFLAYIAAGKAHKEDSLTPTLAKTVKSDIPVIVKEEYDEIANNKELNWQEKYKKLTETEQQYLPDENQNQIDFVTDLGAAKKAIIMPQEQEESSQENIAQTIKSHNDIIREKLQAKISQMEHSLAQTPSQMFPVEIPKGVQSEDNSIVKSMKSVKLKSFSKPIDLRQTNRTLMEDSVLSNNKLYNEGKFVKLKNSALSVNRRKSASSKLKNMNNKYLTNNGEINMNNEQENYLTTSLNEYFSILDAESAKQTPVSTIDSASKPKPVSDAISRSGISNPISRVKDSMPSLSGGLVVKSGYNIDSEKGIYLVNTDGVSALVGKVNDSITVLKKFNHVIDKPLQVRAQNDNVYIARVGNFKCLVDVSNEKMGTLIEI